MRGLEQPVAATDFDTLSKDPFHELPLSAAQWNVHWIFFLRQFWSIAFLYVFAIYGSDNDPKGLGLTAVFSGWLLTASFITPLADIHGRLCLYRFCLGFQLLCLGLICILPFNIFSFMTLCGLLGIGFGPHSSLQTTIWNEAMPARMMNVTTNIQFGSWGIIVPAILYLWKWLRYSLPSLDPWRVAFSSSFVFLLGHLLSSFLLSPSVPWLISQGKIDEAEKSCKSIFGQKQSCDRSALWHYLRENTAPKDNAKDSAAGAGYKKQTSLRSILRTLSGPDLRCTVVVGTIQFASCGLSYWGQSLQLRKFLPSSSENPELFLSLMAIVEIPSSFLSWYLPRRMNFLRSLVFMFVCQGIATLCLLGPLSLAYPALFLVRLVSSVLYNQVWMMSSMAFKVEIRGTGSGLLVNMGRAGSLCAPFLGFMESNHVIWLCALLAFTSAICCVGFVSNDHFMKRSSEMMLSDDGDDGGDGLGEAEGGGV